MRSIVLIALSQLRWLSICMYLQGPTRTKDTWEYLYVNQLFYPLPSPST